MTLPLQCTALLVISTIASAFPSVSQSEERDPICLESSSAESVESKFLSLNVEDAELLARLTWAETESLLSGPKAGACVKNFDVYAKAIAWVVRARVDLARRNARHRKLFGSGWYGVIFKKGQFNPAVSRKSAFQKLFICPQKSSRFLKHWLQTQELADKVLDKHSLSPLVATRFEMSEGYSLVSHLYYPLSSQATSEPPAWVRDLRARKLQVRGLKLDGLSLSDDCLWMFRGPR